MVDSIGRGSEFFCFRMVVVSGLTAGDIQKKKKKNGCIWHMVVFSVMVTEAVDCATTADVIVYIFHDKGGNTQEEDRTDQVG